MTKSRRPTRYVAWGEDQVLYAVQLFIEHGLNGPGDWVKITRKHNDKFDLNRSVKSMKGIYHRIRDSFMLYNYKEVWKLMSENPECFRPRRVSASSNLSKKIEDLTSRLDKKDEQIEHLMTLLDDRTRPSQEMQ